MVNLLSILLKLVRYRVVLIKDKFILFRIATLKNSSKRSGGGGHILHHYRGGGGLKYILINSTRYLKYNGKDRDERDRERVGASRDTRLNEIFQNCNSKVGVKLKKTEYIYVISYLHRK